MNILHPEQLAWHHGSLECSTYGWLVYVYALQLLLFVAQLLFFIVVLFLTSCKGTTNMVMPCATFHWSHFHSYPSKSKSRYNPSNCDTSFCSSAKFATSTVPRCWYCLPLQWRCGRCRWSWWTGSNRWWWWWWWCCRCINTSSRWWCWWCRRCINTSGRWWCWWWRYARRIIYSRVQFHAGRAIGGISFYKEVCLRVCLSNRERAHYQRITTIAKKIC